MVGDTRVGVIDSSVMCFWRVVGVFKPKLLYGVTAYSPPVVKLARKCNGIVEILTHILHKCANH